LLELSDLTLGGGGSFLDGEDTVRVQMVGDVYQIYLPHLDTFLLHLLLCHPELLKLVADH
jgi:hypothetical protein